MRFDEAVTVNGAVKAVAIAHRGRAAQLLADLGLSVGQEQVLLTLEDQGARTQSQLAAAARCEPPTMTMAVRKLENAGLVRREQSASDARANVVELTDAGRDLMPQLRAAFRKLADETMAGLDADERELLLRLLARVGENLGVPCSGGHVGRGD